MKNKFTFIFLISLVSISLVSCNQKKVEANQKWPEKLTIVQMPDENNPDAGEMNKEFTKAMEEYVGIKVEQFSGMEYSVGIEAMKNNKLDILLVTPMSYYQAQKNAKIEPLVTTSIEDAPPYKSVFITSSKNKDINSLKDLKNKSFAFVDPASSSGYMFPKAKLIKDLKLESDKLEANGYFFDTVTFSGKHDASLMGVVMGDYDSAVVAYQVIDSLVKANLIKNEDIKIIGETDTIPNASFVIRQDLPKDLKAKIKEFYLQFDDENYFKSFYKDEKIRFIESKDSDYEIVKEMVKLLKIEESK